MKKYEQMEVWKQKREKMKKETEERLSKTDLSDQVKENYLNSLSYLQKDQKIKGNLGRYYFETPDRLDELSVKYKNQQKERYQFEKQYFGYRLDDWEIVSFEPVDNDWNYRQTSPDFNVLIKIPNNSHKKGLYEFDSFFKGKVVSSKKYDPFEERFVGRNGEVYEGKNWSTEFDHSTFGENQTHWFVGKMVPDYIFNHLKEETVSNHPSWIRNQNDIWIDCKEIPCFTDSHLQSLDDWVVEYSTPEHQMVRKYDHDDKFQDTTDMKVDEYIKTNLQYPPSYDELMNQFIDTRVS